MPRKHRNRMFIEWKENARIFAFPLHPKQLLPILYFFFFFHNLQPSAIHICISLYSGMYFIHKKFCHEYLVCILKRRGKKVESKSGFLRSRSLSSKSNLPSKYNESLFLLFKHINKTDVRINRNKCIKWFQGNYLLIGFSLMLEREKGAKKRRKYSVCFRIMLTLFSCWSWSSSYNDIMELSIFGTANWNIFLYFIVIWTMFLFSIKNIIEFLFKIQIISINGKRKNKIFLRVIIKSISYFMKLYRWQHYR